MPGIAGVIGNCLDGSSRETVKRMLLSMDHEVWYESGIYASPGLSICVGWTNHRGAFADCAPIFNESRDLALILAGEVFHDSSDIQRLRSKGHNFAASNASYLIHLYEEIGDDIIKELNGWFSGVLLDYRRRRVLLFNDRYGVQRVFICVVKGDLYFSSEAKALLAVVPETREFDPKGLGEFLTCGCTLRERSLFRNISILPSASLWVFEDGVVTKKGPYFEAREWQGDSPLDKKHFLARLVESFGDIVKRYSAGSLPVGISLTGGLDSRMMLACLDTSAQTFPCYTFGSPYRETFDVRVAREVAMACGQTHHVLTLGGDFLDDFPRHLEKAVYLSDGYIGLSGAAELYVNSMARRFAPVRLTANFGGELLRGDRAFKSIMPQGAFVTPALKPYLYEAEETFAEVEATDPVTFAVFQQAPSQGYGRLAIERSQVVLRTPFMDNDLIWLVYRAPPELLKGTTLSVALISRYNPDLLNIPTDRGFLWNDSPLGSLVRRFHREALFKAEYWSTHGMPSWLAGIAGPEMRRALEKHLAGRHKFQHFSIWTRERLGVYLTEVLLDGISDLAEFFDRQEVEAMVRQHVEGRRNYLGELDKLVTITLARQSLFKQSVLRAYP